MCQAGSQRVRETAPSQFAAVRFSASSTRVTCGSRVSNSLLPPRRHPRLRWKPGIQPALRLTASLLASASGLQRFLRSPPGARLTRITSTSSRLTSTSTRCSRRLSHFFVSPRGAAYPAVNTRYATPHLTAGETRQRVSKRTVAVACGHRTHPGLTGGGGGVRGGGEARAVALMRRLDTNGKRTAPLETSK